MIITDEIKNVFTQSPFISIATISSKGEPHMIVVGKGEIMDGDILSFGIYKMEKTQQNIKNNDIMQVVVATTEGGPKGFRLTGKASIKDSSILFKADKAEAML